MKGVVIERKNSTFNGATSLKIQLIGLKDTMKIETKGSFTDVVVGDVVDFDMTKVEMK